jgi:hypothetical protein
MNQIPSECRPLSGPNFTPKWSAPLGVDRMKGLD